MVTTTSGYEIATTDCIWIYKAGVPVRLPMTALRLYIDGASVPFLPGEANATGYPLCAALDGTEFTEINIGNGYVPYTLAAFKSYVLNSPPTTSQVDSGTVYPALTGVEVKNMLKGTSVYYSALMSELKTFLTT